jgi:hypothetical protein
MRRGLLAGVGLADGFASASIRARRSKGSTSAAQGLIRLAQLCCDIFRPAFLAQQKPDQVRASTTSTFGPFLIV